MIVLLSSPLFVKINKLVIIEATPAMDKTIAQIHDSLDASTVYLMVLLQMRSPLQIYLRYGSVG